MSVSPTSRSQSAQKRPVPCGETGLFLELSLRTGEARAHYRLYRSLVNGRLQAAGAVCLSRPNFPKFEKFYWQNNKGAGAKCPEIAIVVGVVKGVKGALAVLLSSKSSLAYCFRLSAVGSRDRRVFIERGMWCQGRRHGLLAVAGGQGKTGIQGSPGTTIKRSNERSNEQPTNQLTTATLAPDTTAIRRQALARKIHEKLPPNPDSAL